LGLDSESTPAQDVVGYPNQVSALAMIVAPDSRLSRSVAHVFGSENDIPVVARFRLECASGTQTGRPLSAPARLKRLELSNV